MHVCVCKECGRVREAGKERERMRVFIKEREMYQALVSVTVEILKCEKECLSHEREGERE